ncbi:TadE/TadG family type IV pilus assembly protein [Aestuariivirga sp.]|uniref:TadE/TadG family type IV pilus assembly protein n=1 Tax=Aestuariivirga sp. TaxID=2650926 RepID=UPI003019F856
MASRSREGERGAALIEFTAVMFVLFVFVLGTVDLCLLMVNWASYNRATYAGARFAVVTNPVATNINATITANTGSYAGDSCLNSNTGAASGSCVIKAAAICNATNTAGSAGSCTGGYTFDTVAMPLIVSKMNSAVIIGQLDARQVTVTYTPTSVGFVSRPNGSPMSVTVSLRCVQNELFFINYLMRWVLPTPAACSGFTPPKGLPLPSFATTLPSEDLTTN